jgi:hypothetical protein
MADTKMVELVLNDSTGMETAHPKCSHSASISTVSVEMSSGAVGGGGNTWYSISGQGIYEQL